MEVSKHARCNHQADQTQTANRPVQRKDPQKPVCEISGEPRKIRVDLVYDHRHEISGDHKEACHRVKSYAVCSRQPHMIGYNERCKNKTQIAGHVRFFKITPNCIPLPAASSASAWRYARDMKVTFFRPLHASSAFRSSVLPNLP